MQSIKYYKLSDNEYLQIIEYVMNNKKYLSGIQITYNDSKPAWKHLKADKIPSLIKVSIRIKKLPKQTKELTKTSTWMYGTHKEKLIDGKLYLIQQQRNYKNNKLINEIIKEVIIS